MKNSIQSLAKAGLLSAVIISLTGCVTKTVYITQAPPPAEPAPEPEVVQAPPPEPVQTSVVIQHESDFYEPLRPYGQWVFIASYGRCWRPSRIDAGWRPYSNGNWVRTDAGWFWASDEPWAWATYHYGRWDWTQAYGWIWVPQTLWAPAWVSWRQGNGYVGWAPLPPAARITVNGYVEVHETIIAPRFVFVQERRMLDPVRPRTVIVNNQTVINNTVNITKIHVNNHNKTVINEGPKTEVIEHATGRKVKETPSHDLRHDEESKVAHKKNDPPGQQRRNDPPGQQRRNDPPGQAKKTPAPEEANSTRPAPRDNGTPKTPAIAETPRSTPIEANQHQAPVVANPKKPAPADVTPPQTPVEVKAQPIVVEEKTIEPKQEPVSAKPAHPEVEQPNRKGGKPVATPVAKKESKPEGKKDSKPEANTHENQPAAKPAKPVKEQRSATITVQAREVQSSETKSAPANEPSQPANRTPVKSPKANNAAHEPGSANSQKNQKNKKGESTETTEKSSTSPSAQ